MSRLEELKRNADEAELAARVAKMVYVEALKRAYEFQPGDVIKSSKGKLARVTGLKLEYNKVQAIAVIQKINGEFGQREVPMWQDEWGRATLHQRAIS